MNLIGYSLVRGDKMNNISNIKRTPIKHIYGYIYLTTNLVNGRKYIGQHAYSKPEVDKTYLGSGKALEKAINKYGKENFIVDILGWAQSLKELDELEKYFIRELDAVESRIYYNLSVGGHGISRGSRMSQETRKKMSMSRMGEKNPMYQNGILVTGRNNGMYGKIHSKETKQKIREKAINRNLSGENNPCYGEKHPLSRQPVCLSLSGDLIRRYHSMADAERDGFYKQGVRNACIGKTKSYRGYKWMYLEDYKETQL